jgi:hypothetical protein
MTNHVKSPVAGRADTGQPPIWPPPPRPIVAAIWAGALSTVIAIATQHPEVALAAAMVTFGFATVAMLAMFTSYSSPAQTTSGTTGAAAPPAPQTPTESGAREAGP